MRKTLLIVALVLSACGGAAADSGDGVASLDESSATTVVEENVDPEAAAIEFTACMRENGVEMEDPTVDEDGNVIPGQPTDLPDPEERQAGGAGPGGAIGEELGGAFEACGDLLEGTTFGFTEVDQTELQDQLLDLAQCLRDEGLDVADPDLSGAPGEGGGFTVDIDDPEMQAAMEQCEEFLPNFGGGGPGPVGAGPAGSDN